VVDAAVRLAVRPLSGDLGVLEAFFVWIANNSFTDGLAVAIFRCW
jgi:hypothetical protein